jgi:acyl-activating enzyme 14
MKTCDCFLTVLGIWCISVYAASSAQVLDAEGWVHTGDMGYFDSQGRLWLRGRAKDMVKSGGENVYAAEVGACVWEMRVLLHQ